MTPSPWGYTYSLLSMPCSSFRYLKKWTEATQGLLAVGTSNVTLTRLVTLCVIIGVQSPFQSFMFSHVVIWGIAKAWYTLNKVAWATAYPKLLLPQPLIPVDQFGSLYLIPSCTGDWFGVARRRYCLVSSGSLVCLDVYPFHQIFVWYQKYSCGCDCIKAFMGSAVLFNITQQIYPHHRSAWARTSIFYPAIWHHGEGGGEMSKGLEQLDFRPDFVANCATLIKYIFVFLWP